MTLIVIRQKRIVVAVFEHMLYKIIGVFYLYIGHRTILGHYRNQSWIDESSVWSTSECCGTIQHFLVQFAVYLHSVILYEASGGIIISLRFNPLNFLQQVTKQTP